MTRGTGGPRSRSPPARPRAPISCRSTPASPASGSTCRIRPSADVTAGLFGVIGVLGALVERGRSGLGQRVSTSLLAAQVGIHTFQATRYLIAGEVPGPSGNHHPTVAPYGMFQAADGPLVIAVGNDEIWLRFAPLIGLDPGDSRFRTNALRLGHLADLHRLLAARLSSRTVAQWLELLRQGGRPRPEGGRPAPGPPPP